MENIRNFPDITYDLSEDLVHGEIIRLDHHALTLCIAHILKKNSIIEAFAKIERPYEKNRLKVINGDIILCFIIELLVFGEFKSHFDIQLRTFDHSMNSEEFLRNYIVTIVSNIFQFLRKIKLSHADVVRIFLKNLAITSQLTVNTKKTVLRVLKQKKYPTLGKFKLSVKFFFKDLVYKYYYALSEHNKSFVERELNVEKDFPLYFWMWQIKNTRKEIPKIKAWAFSKEEVHFLIKSDKNDDNAIRYIFRKAIEDHNEMAVQYLWTNFMSVKIDRKCILLQIFHKHVRSFLHRNTIMYLLLQVNENEVNKYFTRHLKNIYRFVINDPRFFECTNLLSKFLAFDLAEQEKLRREYDSDELNAEI